MFEIGSSLREARERRNLSYGQVEAETAIRTRYIRALEDEDFHILPGPTYTKGFLRAYAEYLGLDGQPFVDEFNSRHHDPRGSIEQTPITSRPRSRPPQRRRHRRESNLIMIALAAIVAVASLIVLALRFPPQQPAPYNTNTGTQHDRVHGRDDGPFRDDPGDLASRTARRRGPTRSSSPSAGPPGWRRRSAHARGRRSSPRAGSRSARRARSSTRRRIRG